MKMPLSPPEFPDLSKLDWSVESTAQYVSLLLKSAVGPVDGNGRYLHWDKLRHLSPPQDYTSELYWHATRQARSKLSKRLPFADKMGNPFSYCLPDCVIRDMLWIHENATGAIQADHGITDPATKKSYIINSLVEEAISSSQLEGAATTRRVAKEMIRTGRAPKNHSEKMIFNNYRAMSFIREVKEESLTPSIVFELHKILTEGTLEQEDQGKAGVFRDGGDDICVFSLENELLHVPPKAQELPARLQNICDFINDKRERDGAFIPPIIKAIIVHFMIGYDHPFVDGNGRTARALFYWIMSRENFWLMEYISISRVIKKAPAQYMQAFLYTETDENDVTYFLVHQMGVIRKAIDDLHLYLAKKSQQKQEVAEILEASKLKGLLNFRQISLIRNALKNPGAEYTIKSHQTSHGVAYQTARTDLFDLCDKYRLIKKFKSGRTDVFIAPADLAQLIFEYK
jgi:Fic family protein